MRLPLTKKSLFLSTINTFAVGKIGSKNEAEALEQTAWQFLVSIQSLLKGKTLNKWLLVVGGTTFIPEIFFSLNLRFSTRNKQFEQL